MCIKDSTLLQRGIKELIYSPLLSYAPHFLAFRVYVVREEREREREREMSSRKKKYDLREKFV